MIESYQYDLYGKPKVYDSGGTYQPNATPQAKDLGDGGARWIPELALYDDRNRFMSPVLGRFLQPDPIGFKGDASNLYRYCGNDWANRTDLMGLEDMDSWRITNNRNQQAYRDKNSDHDKLSSERGAILGGVGPHFTMQLRNPQQDNKGFTMGGSRQANNIANFADGNRFSLRDPKVTVSYKPSQGWLKGGHLKDLGHVILETPNKYLDFGDDGGYKEPPGTPNASDVRPDFSGFKSKTISVKPEAMNAIEGKVQQYRSENKDFNVLTLNYCSSEVSAALSAGGIHTNGFTPSTLWSSLPSEPEKSP